MEWQRLPDLNFEVSAGPAIGRAGMCVGVVSGKLLVLGGSNFPEPGRTATRGGVKTYHDDGLVFEEARRQWRPAGIRLPRPADQMLSISRNGELFCIGGMAVPEGAVAASATLSVYRIFEHHDGEFALAEVANLPAPISAPVGAIVNNKIYVASASLLYRFDPEVPDRGWSVVSEIPWSPRDEYAAFAMGSELVFAGGRRFAADQWEILSDVLAFDPVNQRWRNLPSLPVGLAWATGVSLDADHTYIFGGVGADPFRAIEALRREASLQPEMSEARRAVDTQITAYFDHDPGFELSVWRLEESAGQWRFAGWHPGLPAIKRNPVPYAEGYVLAGGEINPGKRTPIVWYLKEKP